MDIPNALENAALWANLGFLPYLSLPEERRRFSTIPIYRRSPAAELRGSWVSTVSRNMLKAMWNAEQGWLMICPV
jgi:hypothetical protein